MKAMIVSLLAAFLFIGCNSKDIEMHQMQNGNQAIVDVKNRRVIVINQSDRIVDVINIDLDNNEIKTIKDVKDSNDKKLKVIHWNKIIPTNEKYTVNFSTRYYNDKCLFVVEVSPWDTKLSNGYGFRVTSIGLNDSSGFTLENIDLSDASWTKILDDSGNPVELELSGKIPMTLENYMEIVSWNPTWRSSSREYGY